MLSILRDCIELNATSKAPRRMEEGSNAGRLDRYPLASLQETASSRSSGNRIRTRATVGGWVSTFDPSIPRTYSYEPPFQPDRVGIQTALTRYKRRSPRHPSTATRRTILRTSIHSTHDTPRRSRRTRRNKSILLLDWRIQFASRFLFTALLFLPSPASWSSDG